METVVKDYFRFVFKLDTEKTRSFTVKDAKTDLSNGSIQSTLAKIIGSGVLNSPVNGALTDVTKGQLYHDVLERIL